MNTKVLQICLILLIGLVGCINETKVKPISERILKVYTVQEVKHDGVVVYSAGKTGNLFSDYSTYRLDLSVSGRVTLREVTGDSFAGAATVSGNDLTLSNLSPQPSGSNGTLIYIIVNVSDDGKTLMLRATKGSPKTGNTINEYTLVAS